MNKGTANLVVRCQLCGKYRKESESRKIDYQLVCDVCFSGETARRKAESQQKREAQRLEKQRERQIAKEKERLALKQKDEELKRKMSEADRKAIQELERKMGRL
jgi:hypothetical protein